MNISNRVNLQNCSDQQLIDLFGQSRDRQALAELYERYRVSVGSYLYQGIKSKKTVLDTFNTIMMDLVSNPSSQGRGRNVSVQLFSMAYQRRTEYMTNNAQRSTVQRATSSTQEKIESESKFATLPRLHKDVIELVYENNFAVDEVADIIGRTSSVIRDCLLYIKTQRPLFDGSDSSVVAMKVNVTHTEARMP